MFRCNECGYKGKSVDDQGACGACGSFNIVKMQAKAASVNEEKTPKTKVEIAIMILVWGLLFYGIWERYLQPYFSEIS